MPKRLPTFDFSPRTAKRRHRRAAVSDLAVDGWAAYERWRRKLRNRLVPAQS